MASSGWFFRPIGGGIIEAPLPSPWCRVLRRVFFRPIGGGIIEAENHVTNPIVQATSSSALLGAASLKHENSGAWPARAALFFRPIGGGIIEALQYSCLRRADLCSSALLGAASLKLSIQRTSES